MTTTHENCHKSVINGPSTSISPKREQDPGAANTSPPSISGSLAAGIYGRPAMHFDSGAAMLGPIWAGRHGKWLLFALASIVELIGFVLLVKGFTKPGPGATPWCQIGGLTIMILARIGMGSMGSRLRRGDQAISSTANRRNLIFSAILLAAFYGFTFYHVATPRIPSTLSEFPSVSGLEHTTAKYISSSVDWMKRRWGSFFDTLTWILRVVLNFVESCFVKTPWIITGGVFLVTAWRCSRPGTAAFTFVSLACIGCFGYWEKSMATLALVATSVIICVVIGIPIGILCAKSRRLNTLIEPILDVMQTLPTFVYLIPAVAFFSIGKPPGVMSTIIFALPPMVRLTTLGIREVDPQIREAALAFGAKPIQLLIKVELPLSLPSIKLGINQTIMMSLSMVVIAAMIGAGGLGLDVIRSLQYLKTGEGVLAGMAIVLCAMVLNRILEGNQSKKDRQYE